MLAHGIWKHTGGILSLVCLMLLSSACKRRGPELVHPNPPLHNDLIEVEYYDQGMLPFNIRSLFGAADAGDDMYVLARGISFGSTGSSQIDFIYSGYVEGWEDLAGMGSQSYVIRMSKSGIPKWAKNPGYSFLNLTSVVSSDAGYDESVLSCGIAADGDGVVILYDATGNRIDYYYHKIPGYISSYLDVVQGTETASYIDFYTAGWAWDTITDATHPLVDHLRLDKASGEILLAGSHVLTDYKGVLSSVAWDNQNGRIVALGNLFPGNTIPNSASWGYSEITFHFLDPQDLSETYIRSTDFGMWSKQPIAYDAMTLKDGGVFIGYSKVPLDDYSELHVASYSNSGTLNWNEDYRAYEHSEDDGYTVLPYVHVLLELNGQVYTLGSEICSYSSGSDDLNYHNGFLQRVDAATGAETGYYNFGPSAGEWLDGKFRHGFTDGTFIYLVGTASDPTDTDSGELWLVKINPAKLP